MMETVTQQTSDELQPCQKEAFLLKFFGIKEFKENQKVDVDLGTLTSMLYMFEGERTSQAEEEREVMIQAFDQVRKLFECRDWIMEGRGSYPYNDERYKQEVRYLYDEFHSLQKEVWTKIKSHAYEYKKAVIEEYKKSQQQAFFQPRVNEWMQLCFGEVISKDQMERNHRFLEEAFELVQSLGCTQSEAHQLVYYVFNRRIGEPYKEAGGVMVTLAALCNAAKIDMQKAGETELSRIYTIMAQIRKKHASKPNHSPLPGQTPNKAICDYCEGCGWYEGGKAIKTTCEKCNGTGEIDMDIAPEEFINKHVANIQQLLKEARVRQIDQHNLH